MVHSSAATIGIVMVLSQAGLLDLKSAICIMLGDNIGTCLTAQLASMNGNINARRTAWAHTFYNLFGGDIDRNSVAFIYENSYMVYFSFTS